MQFLFLILIFSLFIINEAFNLISKPVIFKSGSSKNDQSSNQDTMSSIDGKRSLNSIENSLKRILPDDYDPPENNILFFTSVGNLIPAFVYEDFLKSLHESSVDGKIKSNILIPKEKKDIKKLPSQENLTIISHASGTIEALKYAKNKNVKNLILIDPVDSRIEKILSGKKFVDSDDLWEDDELELNFPHIEKALFLYTEKSYKWDESWNFMDTTMSVLFNPFLFTKKNLLPSFIPEKLSIKPKNIIISPDGSDSCDCEEDCSEECCKSTFKLPLKILNYGLCDILNENYSTFIHNTICEGHPDRSEENINNYHKVLALFINIFLSSPNLKDTELIVKTSFEKYLNEISEDI
tara:strand:- start:211 stop:1266 length:1056 start_codon:yes stop_codon:yes gene_type:complete